MIWGTVLGAVFASATELSQREYDFTMRKDRVSSWMETPQDPAVSERMQGNANGHKSKSSKPKICRWLGPGLGCPRGRSGPRNQRTAASYDFIHFHI